MKLAMLVALGVLAFGYVVVLVVSVRRQRRTTEGVANDDNRWWPTFHHTLIGFVTNFFDTLGIGNFAPTTAWFRYARLVPTNSSPAP